MCKHIRAPFWVNLNSPGFVTYIVSWLEKETAYTNLTTYMFQTQLPWSHVVLRMKRNGRAVLNSAPETHNQLQKHRHKRRNQATGRQRAEQQKLFKRIAFLLEDASRIPKSSGAAETLNSCSNMNPDISKAFEWLFLNSRPTLFHAHRSIRALAPHYHKVFQITPTEYNSKAISPYHNCAAPRSHPAAQFLLGATGIKTEQEGQGED